MSETHQQEQVMLADAKMKDLKARYLQLAGERVYAAKDLKFQLVAEGSHEEKAAQAVLDNTKDEFRQVFDSMLLLRKQTSDNPQGVEGKQELKLEHEYIEVITNKKACNLDRLDAGKGLAQLLKERLFEEYREEFV